MVKSAGKFQTVCHAGDCDEMSPEKCEAPTKISNAAFLSLLFFNFGFVIKQIKMTDIQIYTKITTLPQELKKEVVDFIDFLAEKKEKFKSEKKRVFGYAKDSIILKPGFDETPAEFKEYL